MWIFKIVTYDMFSHPKSFGLKIYVKTSQFYKILVNWLLYIFEFQKFIAKIVCIIFKK